MSTYKDEPSEIDERALFQWLDKRAEKLGSYDYIGGKKILLNSPWASDVKKHLGLFPKRGKYGRFRDFKSGKNGSLVNFVMEIDNIGFREALMVVCSSVAHLSKAIDTPSSVAEVRHDRTETVKHRSLQLPPGCLRMLPQNANDPILTETLKRTYEAAYQYMLDRVIDPERFELYYCIQNRKMPDGRMQKLKNRIVIPMYDWNNELWYWTARAMSIYQGTRYLEPTPEDGGGTKEEVLFAPSWDIHGKSIVVCEGSIDAYSLKVCDFKSVSTQGSAWYREQQETLEDFDVTPVFAYDNDEAGQRGLYSAASSWKGLCYYVFPLPGMDWNLMLQKMGRKAVQEHLLKNIQPIDERAIDVLRMNSELSKTMAKSSWKLSHGKPYTKPGDKQHGQRKHPTHPRTS